MRIITISSGKGGVGKTSFAINFSLSLSQLGKTILIDLDTCTSSIRNSLDVPITRDLYHFFRKGYSLEDCVTTLNDKIDPKNRYPNFGFVAGPMCLIDELTNMDMSKRYRIIDAINSLNVKYIVLDLKSGLDPNVLDFLPYSNTGILVFTPHLPAATKTASDIVKALLLRKLRSIFAYGSPIYQNKGLEWNLYDEIHSWINRVEDVYDQQFVNLDAFLVWLKQKLGSHRVMQLISNTIEYFRAYFVLNMFHELNESYEMAIKPFVENIVDNISSRITISNLGSIINSPKLHHANCSRIPVLLYDDVVKPKKEEIQRRHIDEFLKGLVTEKTAQTQIPDEYKKSDAKPQLSQQLEILKTIYTQTKHVSIEQNFEYIRERAAYLLQGRRISDFGDNRLFKKGEILQVLFQRGQ